jgi:hypothetical protein
MSFQNLKLSRLWAALFSLLFLSAAKPLKLEPFTETRTREAVAYNPENPEEVLYSEKHEQQWRGKDKVLTRTEYRDSSDKLFAIKTLDYQKNKILPEMHFSDQRLDIEIVVQSTPEGVTFTVKKNKDNETRTETLKAKNKPLVFDEGIEHLVQERWDELLNGNVIKFDILVPGDFKTYPLRIHLKSLYVKNQMQYAEVHLQPDILIARWFMDPMPMHYRVKDKALVAFTGITNITDEKNHARKTAIVYEDFAQGPMLAATENTSPTQYSPQSVDHYSEQ